MSLSGWENSNRLQFTVPIERVGVCTEIVPILFRLSNQSGFSKTDICHVFNHMAIAGSSYASRKKVAFSQIVDGEEKQLYAELDMWDHVTEKALFWFLPLEVSSTYTNVFYFYYDVTKESNVSYISEAGDLAIYPLIPSGSYSVYDTYGGEPISIIKHNGKYLLWYMGKVVVGGYWHGAIYYCESLDLINFTNFTICVDDVPTETRIYKTAGTVLLENDVFKMWYSGNNANSTLGHRIFYCESLDGKVWYNFIECTGLDSTSFYDTRNGKQSPCVIAEGSVYKMWYSGVGIGNTYYYSILYAESSDGISWVNRQGLLHETTIDIDVVISTININFAYFENGLYYVWIKVNVSGGGTMYYASSEDGKTFTDFHLFSEFNLQGTYDLTNISGIFVYKEFSNLYTLLYSGVLSSQYCILRVDSVKLENPIIPSQLVWKDKFSSVHHFNPSFGYVNSTDINSPVLALNNVSITSDNLGSYAIKFNSLTSTADLGTNHRYNYGYTSQALIFGTIDDGNIIMTKGLYSKTSMSLYYQQTPLLTRDSLSDDFSGPIGDPLDPYLWTILLGGATLDGNRIKFDTNLDNRITTNYYVGDDFDFSFDFDVTGGNLSDDWAIRVRLHFVGEVNEYLFSVTRSNNLSYIYIQQVAPGTFTTKWGVNIGSVVDYFSGKIRIYNDGTTTKYTYYYDGAWYNGYSVGSTTKTYTKIILNNTQGVSNTGGVTSFYISNFYTNENCSFFRRSSRNNNVLAMEYRYNNITHILELPDYTLSSDWLSYTLGVSSNFTDLNALLGDSDTRFLFKTAEGVRTNETSVILGDLETGITGKISEVFFFKHQISSDSVLFMNRSLKDELIEFSNYFVRGYTTIYNKTYITRVLVYDQNSGDLLGSSITDNNGFYYLEVPFRSAYFIIGVGDSLHNDFILSNITPQLIL